MRIARNSSPVALQLRAPVCYLSFQGTDSAFSCAPFGIWPIPFGAGGARTVIVLPPYTIAIGAKPLIGLLVHTCEDTSEEASVDASIVEAGTN